MSRRKIPKKTEAAVLIQSARRCCLCFGLNGDFSEKKGQIAHLDRNSANNSERNLVFLCLEHHDAYDSSTSQGKGLTKKEVAFYRANLFEAVEIKLPGRSAKDPEGFPAELAEVAAFLAAVTPNQPFRSSILNSFEILRAYQEKFLTIEPFSPERLVGFGYRLSTGEDALIDGHSVKVSKEHPLELNRFESMTVSTQEIISIPHWLAGRFAPLASVTRLGLSIDAPGHVDPGFRGRLFVRAQNLGSRPITVAPNLPMLTLELWLLNVPLYR